MTELGNVTAASVPNVDIMTINQKVDFFANILSTIGTWAGAGLASLAVILTIAFAIAAFFGFAESKRIRHVTDKLAQDLSNVAKTRDELTAEKDAMNSNIASALNQIRTDLERFKSDLSNDVSRKLSIARLIVSGEIYYNLGDFDGANDSYLEASQKDPENNEILYYLGRTYTYLNKIALAETHFRTLIGRAPGDPNWFRGLSLAMRFQRPQEALDHLDTAIGLAVNDKNLLIKLYNEKALVYRDLGEYQNCLDFHLRAESLDRKNTLTIYFIGIAKLLIGNWADGANYLERAAANTDSDLEAKEIKPIWANVIKASQCSLHAGPSFEKFRAEANKWETKKDYLALTIRSHFSCLQIVHQRNQTSVSDPAPTPPRKTSVRPKI